MPRFRVDPRRVKMVQMKDGTRYRPSADGYVNVSHRHEDEMRRSPATTSHHEAQIGSVVITLPGGSGRPCPSCSFTGWDWQTECPRCGDILE